MSTKNCDLHITDARGREYSLRATPRPDGWFLHGSIDGRDFTKTCGDWQAVERTATLLKCQGARPVSSQPDDGTRIRAGMRVAYSGQ